MAEKPRYYITTAISYPNGPPHIGHAYEVIATDAIARFKRLDGYDVFFLTGTDEHGQKIQQTATREGIAPRELVDRNVARFRAMVERLNCSNDDFIRTTEERHHRSSEEIWRRMEKNGDIYLSKYAGWYSVRDEAYYAEDETHLNDDKVRLATKTGTPVDWVEEESYFFKLSAYQQKLLDLYERDPQYVLPRERLNEVASFVKGGLQDLSISRTTFDWGIRVPGNPKHIMYVWVDALTNYITAAGFPNDQSAKFKRYWPADLHVIGKDIVRFHAVYWPAFLMSAGIDVPRRIFSHGFLFNRGEKMSKSVGNVIDPFTMADAYGVDQLTGRCFAQKVANICVMFFASNAISRFRRKFRKSSPTRPWSRWGLGRLARAIAPNAECEICPLEGKEIAGSSGAFSLTAAGEAWARAGEGLPSSDGSRSRLVMRSSGSASSRCSMSRE